MEITTELIKTIHARSEEIFMQANRFASTPDRIEICKDGSIYCCVNNDDNEISASDDFYVEPDNLCDDVDLAIEKRKEKKERDRIEAQRLRQERQQILAQEKEKDEYAKYLELKKKYDK